MHGEGAQTVVKIFAELSLGHRLFDVHLGGGQDANIHLDPVPSRRAGKNIRSAERAAAWLCRLMGISVISSRNSVPRWHNSSLPGLASVPIPADHAESSLSSTSPGSGGAIRLEEAETGAHRKACESGGPPASLPLPFSPAINTGALTWASSSAWARSLRMVGLAATKNVSSPRCSISSDQDFTFGAAGRAGKASLESRFPVAADGTAGP